MTDGEGLVGFHGYMPAELQYNGTDAKAVWGCDFIVSPECRGKGYGRTFHHVLEGLAPVVLVLGSSDASYRMQHRMGFAVNTDIETFFYTNRRNTPRDLAKHILQCCVMMRCIGKRCSSGDLEAGIVDASSAPHEIDQLWRKVEGGYAKIVKRTYSYIKWKYGSHPLNRYSCIVVTSKGELVGIGIFRKDAQVSTLADYVGPAAAIHIKELIVKVFKDQCSHSHLLECTCTDEEFKTALEHFGFRRYKCRPKFTVLSNIEGDMDPEKRWFIMTGDADNDNI